MEKTYNYWDLKQVGHLLHLYLNRPLAFNSLTSSMLYELREISQSLQNNPDIWAIVVEGKGDHFSAGVDIGLIKPLSKLKPEFFESELRDLQNCLDEFARLPQPKIAKIRGYCIGGGLVLASICDFRIAADTAKFSLPEVKIGIAVIMGTKRITDLAGLANTKEMILLGEMFDASKAQFYGLLNEVVALNELDNKVNALADKFNFLPPRTVQIAKKIIEEGLQLDLKDSQKLEVALQSSLIGSEDWDEAIKSYFEKRPPNFIGH
jgi:enoyl-CoA hydratase/carnithine racemase